MGAPFRRAPPSRAAERLPEHCVTREVLADPRADHAFDGDVRLGDRRAVRLDLHVELPTEVGQGDLAGGIGEEVRESELLLVHGARLPDAGSAPGFPLPFWFYADHRRRGRQA